MHEFFLFSVDAKPQCSSDLECDIDKICYQGSCIFACSRVNCGQNAICMPEFHQGSCKCLPGFTGNPDTGCSKGNSFKVFVKAAFYLYLHTNFQISLVSHLLFLAVSQTMTVQTTLHVIIGNVLILVQNLMFVHQMQIVEWLVTKQFAPVLMDTLVLLKHHVPYVSYDI